MCWKAFTTGQNVSKSLSNFRYRDDLMAAFTWKSLYTILGKCRIISQYKFKWFLVKTQAPSVTYNMNKKFEYSVPNNLFFICSTTACFLIVYDLVSSNLFPIKEILQWLKQESLFNMPHPRLGTKNHLLNICQVKKLKHNR